MKTSLSRWIMLITIAATAVGCAHQRSYNLPPASRLMEPGPGVGGPGPGVLAPPTAPVFDGAVMGDPAMGQVGGYGGCRAMMPVSPPKVQILFARPESMMIRGTCPEWGSSIPSRLSCPDGTAFRPEESTG